MMDASTLEPFFPLFLIFSILPYVAVGYILYHNRRPREREVEALVRPSDAAIAEPPEGEK